MPDLEAQLIKHLSGKPAPFLFVGSGIARRYLDTETWAALLMGFAARTNKSWDEYYSENDGNLPAIASAVAKAFHPIWFAESEYAASRSAYEGKVGNSESPLKIEISKMMTEALGNLDTAGDYSAELQLLRDAHVDGIITTNYDSLLEDLFPGYETYVGQSDLLFRESQGVGEIYKIHGSCNEPDSLVLTQRDYENFDRRNPYLAAKLLTIFVDHPMIFLGYGMNDPDIARILDSIASVLTRDHLDRLQDRLIFIEWERKPTDEPFLGKSTFPVEGARIPMSVATVSDFEAVFAALGKLERELPARVLRQLKERIYELVRTNDPVGALRVVDIDGPIEDMEVVFGVGVIGELGSLGYLPIEREQLLLDILTSEGGYDVDQLMEKVIPKELHRAKYTPIYKYLREAGLLDKEGKLVYPESVDPEVREYVKLKRADFSKGVSTGPAKKAIKECETFADLVTAEPPVKVLRYVHLFPRDDLDLDALRDFLVQAHDEFFVRGSYNDRTRYAKAVCLYDFLKYKKA